MPNELNPTLKSPALKKTRALLSSFRQHLLEHVHEPLVLLESLRGIGGVEVDDCHDPR